MHYDRSDYPILEDYELRNIPVVSEFIHGCEAFLTDEAISYYPWEDLEGPVALRVFHGTVHEFDQFDPRQSDLDGYFGKVVYFTSSHFDATTNYATPSGPDRRRRIERDEEQLYYQILDDPEEFDLPESTTEDEAAQAAKSISLDRNSGNCERTIEAIVRVENPFIVDGDARGVHRPLFPEASDEIHEAQEQVFAYHEVDASEAEDEVHDEADEAAWVKANTYLDRLNMALVRAFGVILPADITAPDTIEGLRYDLTTKELLDLFMESDDLMDCCSEEGLSYRMTIFSEMLKTLGFDAIILLNADLLFHSMKMDAGTSHVQLFGGNPDQVLQLNRDVRAVELDQAA